ncbi:MAG: polysaccharide deacetylase family protein [Planctomycetota bacterium]|nr:polysaccharide deacetylase family protein [Planctomycetota bacterium]
MSTPPAVAFDAPRVAAWPGGKRWVYSITFDEALSDLHKFVVPILASCGVPGHLEVVVGQMGEVRKLGNSSYNGFKHMSASELREMLDRGWGVGNHSWSHEATNAETADLELDKAKQVLERAIGQPITIYCSSGDNTNMNEGALAACRRLGYLGAMSITDALNRPDDADLMWMNRTFLHTQGYGPFFSEFDPWRNLTQAKYESGWVIDYLHCPLETAVHPNKDCSAAELRRRVEAVVSEGGSDVWLARVEDAVDYRYARRAAVITPEAGIDGLYRVAAPSLNEAVRLRSVTLELPRGTYAAEVDGRPAPIVSRGGELLLDVDLSRPRMLRLRRVV